MLYVALSQPHLPLLMQVLKGCKKLAMSVCSMGRIPGGYITNHIYSWVDPQGRSVSPPPDSHEVNQRQGHSMEERTVRTMCVCVCWWSDTNEKKTFVEETHKNSSSSRENYAMLKILLRCL